MNLLDQIGGLLQQYSGGQQDPSQPVEQHFDQVAEAVPGSSMAQGLTAALGSGEAGTFPQLAGQLFSNGNGTQRAGLLNTLLATAGPGLVSQFLGNNSGSMLGSLLSSGRTQISPQQAANVSPGEVEALAQHVHQNDPSIVGRVGELYAEHPALVKTLGGVALAVAMREIARVHGA
jgi:hypothetical protein